jgi:hypothetical protein
MSARRIDVGSVAVVDSVLIESLYRARQGEGDQRAQLEDDFEAHEAGSAVS